MGNVGIGTSTNLISNFNIQGTSFHNSLASFSNAIIQSNSSTPNYNLTEQQKLLKLNDLALDIRNKKKTYQRILQKYKKLEGAFASRDLNTDDFDKSERAANIVDLEAVLSMDDIDIHLRHIASSIVANNEIILSEDVESLVGTLVHNFKEKMQVTLTQLKGNGILLCLHIYIYLLFINTLSYSYLFFFFLFYIVCSKVC